MRTAERLDTRGLLTLQRTIGNAAVVGVLSHRTTELPKPTAALARRSQALVQRFTDDDVNTRAYYIWEKKGKKPNQTKDEQDQNYFEARLQLAIEEALTPPVTLAKVKAAYATAPFSVRQTVAADTALMDKIRNSTLSISERMRVMADLGYRATGETVPHTATKVADDKIRTTLAPYVGPAAAAGATVEGQVVVLGGQDWIDAYYDQFPNELPRGGPTDDEPNTNAYVSRKQGVVIVLHKDRGNPGTTVHEGLHLYSNTTILNQCGMPLNEGFTELFTRKITTPVPPAGLGVVGRDNYQSNWNVATALENAVGYDVMAKAYFGGDLPGLKTAFTDFRKTKGDANHVAQGRWATFVTKVNNKQWAQAINLCT